MADGNIPDSEPTTRTLLRRVLDTEDPHTPRRPQRTRARYVRALPEAREQPEGLAGGVSV